MHPLLLITGLISIGFVLCVAVWPNGMDDHGCCMWTQMSGLLTFSRCCGVDWSIIKPRPFCLLVSSSTSLLSIWKTRSLASNRWLNKTEVWRIFSYVVGVPAWHGPQEDFQKLADQNIVGQERNKNMNNLVFLCVCVSRWGGEGEHVEDAPLRSHGGHHGQRLRHTGDQPCPEDVMSQEASHHSRLCLRLCSSPPSSAGEMRRWRLKCKDKKILWASLTSQPNLTGLSELL